MKGTILAALSGLLSIVTAHGGFSEYRVGDTVYKGYDPDVAAADQDSQPWLIQRKWLSINPIMELDNASLACNYPGTAAVSSIPITAGTNITAVYLSWLHIVGPMMVWLADCGSDCRTVDPAKLRWFKIWEAGLLEPPIATGMWFQRAFQNWDGSPDLWTATIPENLRAGNYLIRHEIISMHVADQPQWYPECAHLKVSGKGRGVPSEGYYASIPGVYSMDDPSIKVDVYTLEAQNVTTYKMPGPPVWTGDEPILSKERA